MTKTERLETMMSIMRINNLAAKTVDIETREELKGISTRLCIAAKFTSKEIGDFLDGTIQTKKTK